MSKSMIEYARSLGNRKNFGTLDTYSETIVPMYKSACFAFANHIEEQDREIENLRSQMQQLINKILDKKD